VGSWILEGAELRLLTALANLLFTQVPGRGILGSSRVRGSLKVQAAYAPSGTPVTIK
jgi:hypothetical protein